MGLRDKYNQAIQTAKQLRMDGSAEERDGRLYFNGTVNSEDEKNQIWNALKTVPDWQKDIVADIKVRGLERTAEPQVYIPARQSAEVLGGLYVPKDLVIRAPRQGLGIVSAVREIVRQVDADQPISNVRTMDEVVNGQTAARSTQARILGALAALALLLAGVGIHGLLAFTVAQRGREIGVRLALGATRGEVFRQILGRGMTLAGVGAALGVGAAMGLSQVMETLLFSVSRRDPVTFIAVPVTLVIVAGLACYLPARRAMRVDPVVALRVD